MMNVEALNTRWTTNQKKKLIKKIKENLIEDKAEKLFSDLETTPDGLLDLRFAPLQLSLQEPLIGVNIKDIDFSNANLGYLILDQVKIQNCKFDSSKIMKWNERSSNIINVSFRSIHLGSDSAIGINSSLYRHINFSKTYFSGVSFYSPQFINCDFSFAVISKVDFSASNFIDCKFAGKIKSVWFNRYYRFPGYEQQFGKAPFNEMKDVDFSNASLWDVMFTGGLDLNSIKLPDDGLHFLIHRFDLAIQAFSKNIDSAHLSPVAMKILRRWLKIFTSTFTTQQMRIFNKAEIIQSMDKEAGNYFIENIIKFDKDD
jgi:uncharacterized protein YjbI with pentapeptide repeats